MLTNDPTYPCPETRKPVFLHLRFPGLQFFFFNFSGMYACFHSTGKIRYLYVFVKQKNANFHIGKIRGGIRRITPSLTRFKPPFQRVQSLTLYQNVIESKNLNRATRFEVEVQADCYTIVHPSSLAFFKSLLKHGL